MGFLRAAEAAAEQARVPLPRAVKTSLAFECSRRQFLSLPPLETQALAREPFKLALDELDVAGIWPGCYSWFDIEDTQLEEDRAEACRAGAAAAARAAATVVVAAAAAAARAEAGLDVAEELGETERHSEKVVTAATPPAFTDWDADV